jgi:hypothetical protein
MWVATFRLPYGIYNEPNIFTEEGVKSVPGSQYFLVKTLFRRFVLSVTKVTEEYQKAYFYAV